METTKQMAFEVLTHLETAEGTLSNLDFLVLVEQICLDIVYDSNTEKDEDNGNI